MAGLPAARRASPAEPSIFGEPVPETSRQARDWRLVPEKAEGRPTPAKEVVVAIARFAAARLEPTLRLTAHDHNKIRVLARLHAGAFIGDDEGRARQHHLRNALQIIGGDGNAIKSGLGGCDIS